MNLKDLGLREWLVVVFIALGLGAFAFEDYFKPKIYEAEAGAQGFDEDVVLKIKAYKKGDKVRITEIDVEHSDTDAIGGVAVTKLIEEVMAKQKFEELDLIAGATFTSEGFKEALITAVNDIKNQ